MKFIREMIQRKNLSGEAAFDEGAYDKNKLGDAGRKNEPDHVEDFTDLVATRQGQEVETSGIPSADDEQGDVSPADNDDERVQERIMAALTAEDPDPDSADTAEAEQAEETPWPGVEKEALPKAEDAPMLDLVSAALQDETPETPETTKSIDATPAPASVPAETPEQTLQSPTVSEPATPVKKIWELHSDDKDDQHAAGDVSEKETVTTPVPAPVPAPVIVEVPSPAVARPGRRAGRVKTRLLGFEHSQDGNVDLFDPVGTKVSRDGAKFPVGWIVVIKGPGTGTSYALANGVSQIGRGDDQTIKLDFGDTSISRSNHAAIAYDDEQREFFLGHGGKANIVRLNDRPVLSTEPLSDADLIRVGETTLRFVAFCGAEFDWKSNDQEDCNDAAIA